MRSTHRSRPRRRKRKPADPLDRRSEVMPRLEVTLTSFAVIVLLAAPIHLMAQGLPTATPEEVGMSSEKLQDVTALMQRHVDFNAIAGAVTLVARHGKVVHYEAVGQRDMEAGAPMTTDTVFRIASMTKPITSIAAMTLYDEGYFELDDPISKWLPEFEKMQVALEDEDGKSRACTGTPDYGPAHPDSHLGSCGQSGPVQSQAPRRRAFGSPKDARGLRPETGHASPGLSAGRTLGIRERDKRGGEARGGPVGIDSRRVLPGTYLQTPRRTGHPFLPARRQAGPLCGPLRTRRLRCDSAPGSPDPPERFGAGTARVFLRGRRPGFNRGRLRPDATDDAQRW